MSVGFEFWFNNKRYQNTLWFKKNNLTFREACFETAKDIRARTNKTLVLPISGGADSMLVYNIFKALDIEVKTIHQRYWTKDPFPLMEGWKTPGLINEYESRHVDLDTTDIIQDIDIEDFQNSDFVKEMVEYCPAPYFAYLQPYIRLVLDKENDYVIAGGNIQDVQINIEKNEPHMPFALGWNMSQWMAYRDLDYTQFYSDNSAITYSRARNSPKDITAQPKEMLFKYYFPEYDHTPKMAQSIWPYFKRYKDLRQEYGESRGYIVNGTWPHYGDPSNDLDVFYEYVDQGHPITATGEWDRSKCSAYSLENINMLSYTTEYYPSNTIPSKNL